MRPGCNPVGSVSFFEFDNKGERSSKNVEIWPTFSQRDSCQV